MPKKKTYQYGILAEKAVICFLILRCYKILFWRYKTHFGEIDVIAKRGKVIAIIEVKARKSKSSIESSIQPQQVNRIKRATEVFLRNNPKFQKFKIRFDFVMVNKFFIPRYYKGFFN